MRIDKTKFVAALHGKRANERCSSCNANDWRAPEGYMLQVVDDHGHVYPGEGTPVVMMICDECGFCRLHAADVLGFSDAFRR